MNNYLNPMYQDQSRAALDEVAFAKVLKRRNSREIIALYLAEAAELLATLQTAVHMGDAFRVHAAAHSLKGSSSYLGAATVMALSADLERVGQSGRVTDTAIPVVAQLEHEFARARQALLAYCGASV